MRLRAVCGFAQFAAINPVVKGPTLVCDDGTVLMDSNLIIDHAEALAAAPSLHAQALAAERLPAFAAARHGERTYTEDAAPPLLAMPALSEPSRSGF